MAKGKKTGGRKHGSPNKLTVSIKSAIDAAFSRVQIGEKDGGVDSLVEWGQQNPDAFYPMWARLAPTEVTADVSGGLVIRVVRE